MLFFFFLQLCIIFIMPGTEMSSCSPLIHSLHSFSLAEPQLHSEWQYKLLKDYFSQTPLLWAVAMWWNFFSKNISRNSCEYSREGTSKGGKQTAWAFFRFPSFSCFLPRIWSWWNSDSHSGPRKALENGCNSLGTEDPEALNNVTTSFNHFNLVKQ